MELTSVLQTLEAVMAGAVSATAPNYSVSYIDTYFEPGGPLLRQIPGSKTGSLNGVTEVEICGAPEADLVSRKITNITIYNADNAAATITISKEVDTTEYDIMKVVLAAGYSLVYDGSGWNVSPYEASASDSKATSNSVVISTNKSLSDSKAASNSTLISGNTSRATSNSVIASTNLSVGDSKAASIVVVQSTNLSTGDSKAASLAVVDSTNLSTALSAALSAASA